MSYALWFVQVVLALVFLSAGGVIGRVRGGGACGPPPRTHHEPQMLSTTLSTVEWKNSTLISGNVQEQLRALKRQPGKIIAILGSATLVNALPLQNLVDELQLFMAERYAAKGWPATAADGALTAPFGHRVPGHRRGIFTRSCPLPRSECRRPSPGRKALAI